MNRKIYYFIFFITVTILSGSMSVSAQLLSSEQDLWLSKRERTIIVRPERNYPPIDFVASGSTGKPQGLGIDYLELIAKKLNVKIQYSAPNSLANILNLLKEGKDGVLVGLTQTTERSEYLYFTKPFISVPAVIVVRKDGLSKRGGLTLADFNGKRVAVGDSYGVESYIKDNYKRIIIEPVSDDEVGLQKLLLGEVEAAVMDIASLSYYTANKALSYVVVGGQTGFNYDLSFAVPKTTPELQVILDEALSILTPQEHSLIKDKWINITNDSQKYKENKSSVLNNNPVLLVVAIIVGGIIFLVAILLVIRSMRKMQNLSLTNHRHSDVTKDDLKEKLEDLEDVSNALSEELKQIKKLEKDIEEKIDSKF